MFSVRCVYRVNRSSAALIALILAGCGGSLGSSDPSDSLMGAPKPKSAHEHTSQEQYASKRRVDTRNDSAINNGTELSRDEVVYGSGKFAASNDTPARKMDIVKDGDVVLNFSDADVREIAQAILGDALSMNFVVDAGVNQRLTLRTNRPLSRSGLLPTLETTLAAAGLVLVKDNDLYRIISASKAKSSASAVAIARSREAVPAGYGVTVVHLNHISPTQMAKVLEPLAPERSLLRVDDARNLIILGATGPDMKTLLDTVDMFDVDQMQGMSFAFLKLKQSRLSELIPELKDVIKAHADQLGGAEPQLVPLERLNSLLVICARPAALSLVKDWVVRLDRTENENESKLFVYHVKNRKAQELSTLLSTLFLNETSLDPGNARPRGNSLGPDADEVELKTENTPTRTSFRS